MAEDFPRDGTFDFDGTSLAMGLFQTDFFAETTLISLEVSRRRVFNMSGGWHMSHVFPSETFMPL